MKHLLIALSSSVLLAGCAGVRVSDTQIASGAANPRSIYIRPFEVAATNYHGQHRGGAGERPIRHSLAGREFAEDLKLELEKIAPAMVIEDNERATQGWVVEGSLDEVGGGCAEARGLPLLGQLGVGRSQLKIHVRVHEVGGHAAHSDKDASKLGRSGDVIYEFDLAGGSRLSGHRGSLYSPGFGDTQPFDFKNAAERVMLALSNDPYKHGVRTTPVAR